GVYGCYLRGYTPQDTSLLDVRLNGKSAGPEQIGQELGHNVFGRFFPILPGNQASAHVVYERPHARSKGKDGSYPYALFIQKEAGTRAIPLSIPPALPEGAKLRELTVDGKRVDGTTIETALSADRTISVSYRLK